MGHFATAMQTHAVPQPPQQISAQQFGPCSLPELPPGSAAQAAQQRCPSASLPRLVKPRPPGSGARAAPQGAFPVPPPQPAAAAPSQPAAAAGTQANAGKARIEEDSPWLACLRCPLTKVGLTGVCFAPLLPNTRLSVPAMETLCCQAGQLQGCHLHGLTACLPGSCRH